MNDVSVTQEAMPNDSDAGHPVRLRLATAVDAAAVHAIYAPIVRETPISFEWDPPDIAEIGARIARTLERLPWIVAVGAAAAEPAAGTAVATPAAPDSRSTPGEAVLGYAYATPYRSRVAYRWSAEVSVYVSRAAQRRGIARRLYQSLFAILRAQHYHIAYAGITVPNAASVALHEALGFQSIGVFPDAGFKFGAWHDVLWMHRELTPAVSDPRELLRLSDVDPATIHNALS